MPRFVDCYKDYNVEAANISLGRGTASSDVLDLLGLDDDEKGIHMSLVTEDTWKNVKKGLQSKLRIDVPGTGIAFIVSLSSIGGKRELGFLIDGQEYKKGDESTLKDTKHELIVAIANYGYNTQVMRAAEEGGATRTLTCLQKNWSFYTFWLLLQIRYLQENSFWIRSGAMNTSATPAR